MNYELELCIDVKCEISEVDHYTCTWIFSSSIFRLASEITFYLTSFFSYKRLTIYSHKEENLISEGGGWQGVGKFLKKNRGTLITGQARTLTLKIKSVATIVSS